MLGGGLPGWMRSVWCAAIFMRENGVAVDFEEIRFIRVQLQLGTDFSKEFTSKLWKLLIV